MSWMWMFWMKGRRLRSELLGQGKEKEEFELIVSTPSTTRIWSRLGARLALSQVYFGVGFLPPPFLDILREYQGSNGHGQAPPCHPESGQRPSDG